MVSNSSRPGTTAIIVMSDDRDRKNNDGQKSLRSSNRTTQERTSPRDHRGTERTAPTLGHAADAPRRRRPPRVPSLAAFLNLALTSIPGVPIGRHAGPPAEPIGRVAGRGLAGKFDFDRFARPLVTCKRTRTRMRESQHVA